MPAVPTLGGDTTGPQVPRQWPGQPSATHAAAVPAHSGTKKSGLVEAALAACRHAPARV